MDRMTKEQRSLCMSRIRGKDTKPEMLVRKFLFGKGYRYRVNSSALPGRPDIVLRKYKAAVFVNGCFWHGHEGCKYYRLPKSNVEFWQSKIERNRARDKEDVRLLTEMGWHVLVIWECQLKPSKRENTLQQLDMTLQRLLEISHKKKIYQLSEEPFEIAAEPELLYFYQFVN